MQLTVQVVLETDDDQDPAVVCDVCTLERGALTADTVGLRLAEANDLLAAVQQTQLVGQGRGSAEPLPTGAGGIQALAVPSAMSSRMIMWTGGCRQGDVAVSRAVLKWRSRRHADQLEAAAETDRRLDWERRSAAVQAAARERDRQLLGQEHAVEILGSTPLPPRSDWHQLRVHELLVSDPTDVLH